MQQIYMQSDEHFDVYTTVFSPQVCRARTRQRHGELDLDKVVAAINYRPHEDDELELHHGDVIQVLFREDQSWWFGRLQNGNEGYFPATFVTKYSPNEKPDEAAPSYLRRGSVPVVSPSSPRGGRGTPKLPRRESLLRVLGHTESSGGSTARGSTARGRTAQASPSLLHRVLSKSRRKSCPHIPAVSGSINRAFQQE
ncbi:jouberin isoform X2 [Hypomesus transpacificus]|uniref:jouberin isoform X2 n=1 Tax=Hypomesus transpacificus TaxID=137520 RepID=UPI001F07B361|nr:jouberin isoform X2 [Hypomesus transpacificus]